MGKLKILKRLITDRGFRIYYLSRRGCYKGMDDEKYLKLVYKSNMKRELNLDDPKTFNEKLQWLKLYDRKPEYTRMVDKYEAKQFVADKIGEEYIIKNYGVWDSFDDIDFDKLPDRFVLKCTHDSGGLVICRDKSKLDLSAARKKIDKSLKINYFYSGREWPYKDVKPRIIAEEYMEDERTGELADYKFYCFGGEARALLVATGRQSGQVKFDFFDMEFNHLDFRRGKPNAKVYPKKPEAFEKMKRLAEKLSCGIPHIRVDFYEVNGRVYFGELTFFPSSGMVPFEPEEWDRTLGSWITLPEKKQSVK